MLRILSSILLSLTFLQGFAQLAIESNTIDTISTISLTTKIINELELADYEIVDTLEKPAGFILQLDYQRYALVLKEKSNWIKIELEEYAYLFKDSIRRIDVNHKGNKELLLYFDHMNGRSNTYGGFSEQTSTICIYDLDARKLLIDFDVHSYYELTEITFYDSTGESVDPYAAYEITDEQELSEEQMDSLNNANEFYVESLTTEADQERYAGDCSYRIEKNKLTLNCNYEEKELGSDASSGEYVSVYLLKDEKWILQK